MFQSVLDAEPVNHIAPPTGTSRMLMFRGTPSLWIRAKMPVGLRIPVLGLNVYQWLGLGLIVLTSIFCAWSFVKLANQSCSRALRLARFDLSSEFVGHNLQPLGLQLALWCLYLQMPLLDLPIGVIGHALLTVKFVWVGLLFWTVARLIDLGVGIYTNSEHLKVRSNLSDMIVPTAARGLKLVLFLTSLGYEFYLVGGSEWLTKMIAGLGLVGLAASLAAQDTLKNFFGTLLLIGEHPFRLGDPVVINGLEGTVEGVGFRSTRLRTSEDSVLTIPNSVIAGASIENRGARKNRRYRCMVPMGYGTPIERMSALRDALREDLLKRPEVFRADKTDIHIFGLGSNSVDLLVNVYLWVASSREEMEARDWLNRLILEHADRLGVEIAAPHQTSRIGEQPALPGHHPAHGGIPAPKFKRANARHERNADT